MGLASDLSPALDGSGLPQSAAALGVDVGSFVRHLFQPQVADLVDGAITNCSSGMALDSLLLAWPGMDADDFLDARRRLSLPSHGTWFWAMFETILGAILLWVVARSLPQAQPLLRGWVGMFGLVLLLHFGAFQIIALMWLNFGVAAEPIMLAPFRSTSLREFWGKRWNLGFRRFAHELIFRRTYRRLGAALAGFLVFLASGLIHDLVISLPARGGYGLPTLYFVVQGIGVAVERSKFGTRLGLGHGVRGWCFMVTLLTAPVFGLFHPWFVLRVILPFMRAIHAL